MNAALPATIAILIDAAAARYGVTRSLARAVAWVESRGAHFDHDDPTAVLKSKAGALGVMQLTPATAASLGVDPLDVRQNVDGGVKLIRRLLDRFDQSEPHALAAYVWGQGNVSRSPDPAGWPESVKAYVLSVRTRADLELRESEEAPTAVRPAPLLDLPTLPDVRAFGFKRATHTHNGIDLRAPHGAPVYAAAPGWVEHANTEWLQGFSGYGRNVVIASLDGARELYAHLDAVHVNPGQRVGQGDQIGTAGRTEFSREDHESLLPEGHDHTHFEVAESAYPMARDARRIDPVEWLIGRMHPIARVLVGGGGRAAAGPFRGSPSSGLGLPPHCPSCSCEPSAAGGSA